QQNQNSASDPFTWYSAKQIADLMNVGVLTATTATDFDNQGNPVSFSLDSIGGYANGSDGALSLALQTDSFTEGTITFGNAPDAKAAVTERIDSASDIQVFTREGRHIAGTTYADIASLITTDNGFTADAEYRDEYLNHSDANGYMGIGVDFSNDIMDEILHVEETDNGYQLAFDRLIGIDTDEASPFGLRASSGQFDYQLTIDQFSVTLNEANVDGDSGEALARAALAEIRSHAPIPSMTGVSQLVTNTSFVITADQRNVLDNNNSLSLNHEGITYLISNDNGSYSVTGGRASTLSLNFDDTTNTISSEYVDLPDDGDSVTIAFEEQQYQLTMNNGEILVTGGEEGRINATFTSEHKLQIMANGGSLNMDEIAILDDTVIAGNLAAARRYGLISDNDTAQTVFSNNNGNYVIPNFDVSQNGNLLVVEKRDTYGVDPMVITTEATSNAGQRITLTDLPDEELII
ncbi:MAG: hypothetical protein ACPGYQ_05510, partial [Candidatus Puniceispirillales bacterium]